MPHGRQLLRGFDQKFHVVVVVPSQVIGHGLHAFFVPDLFEGGKLGTSGQRVVQPRIPLFLRGQVRKGQFADRVLPFIRERPFGLATTKCLQKIVEEGGGFEILDV